MGSGLINNQFIKITGKMRTVKASGKKAGDYFCSLS